MDGRDGGTRHDSALRIPHDPGDRGGRDSLRGGMADRPHETALHTRRTRVLETAFIIFS